MTSLGRIGWALFFSTVYALAAASCATGTDEPSSSSDGGGGTGDPTSSGGAGAGGMGGGGSGGGGGIGGDGGSGGGATSAVEASIVTSSSLFMNCMLGDQPTVAGSFEVKYDNTAGMAAALPKVTSAKLSMTHLGSSYEWSFSVTPESSIVPSGNAPVVTHNAGPGSGTGMGKLCDYCAGIWTLTVTWDIGGKPSIDMQGPLPVNCVQ